MIDASPAGITLALLLTDEELDSLEKRAGDGEIAGRGRPGGSDVASPQPAARRGEPAEAFPANAVAPVRCCGLLKGPRAAGITFRRQRPSRSAATIPAFGHSKSAGIGSAPAST